MLHFLVLSGILGRGPCVLWKIPRGVWPFLACLSGCRWDVQQSFFDNSKLIMFDNWNISFLRKNIFIVETDMITIKPNLT